MSHTKEEQVEYWLKEFTNLSNKFANDGNKELQEYWKGQVMGISKIIDLYKIGVESIYYLRELQ